MVGDPYADGTGYLPMFGRPVLVRVGGVDVLPAVDKIVKGARLHP